MPQTIARVYADGAEALKVAKELKENGFSPLTCEGATATADVVTALRGFETPKGEAEAYAAALTPAGALVAVRPGFGAARRAIAILDSVESVAVELPAAPAEAASSAGLPNVEWTDSTPLSKWFNWPVLLDHDYSMSGKWNLWPLVSDKFPSFGWVASYPLLSDPGKKFSDRFGWKLLQDKTPTFNWFGYPLLTDDDNSASKKFGWQLLLDDPAPLSKALNIPVLKEM